MARDGILAHYEPKDVLLRQGEPDNDLHLILTGEVSITVNGRQVAQRSAGTHVGEMALVDVLAKRSATVVATELTVTLRLPEHKFSQLAQKHPQLWRRVAVEIAKRLRERNRALRQPHIEPVVFIGSSSEGLQIASELHRYLVRKPMLPQLWSEGVFQTSRTSIESLVSLTHEADFAALVITADDTTVSRGRRSNTPRDNVIFELGLLMGALGRERVFILKPKNFDIRIPTDLLGVTFLEYLRGGPRPLRERLRSSCRRIVREVQLIGPR